MGTNTDTKLIEISPYMHQIGHSLNSREITRNVQEGLNTPGTGNPLSHPVLELDDNPFPIFGPMG